MRRELLSSRRPCCGELVLGRGLWAGGRSHPWWEAEGGQRGSHTRERWDRHRGTGWRWEEARCSGQQSGEDRASGGQRDATCTTGGRGLPNWFPAGLQAQPWHLNGQSRRWVGACEEEGTV